MPIKLNCDLGEATGTANNSLNAALMPYIDQANICCGAHAGDTLSIKDTLMAAKQHQVMIGAHPSYPDRAGFGRRANFCSAAETYQQVLAQIGVLDEMAKGLQVELCYVKPHGALYNDLLLNSLLRKAVMRAIADYPKPLKLMLQATADQALYQREAKSHGITLWFEAFADRAYGDDGRLMPRSTPGAVHTGADILQQVQRLSKNGQVLSSSGQALTINADSLCVHGDNPDSVAVIQAIRQTLRQATCP